MDNVGLEKWRSSRHDGENRQDPTRWLHFPLSQDIPCFEKNTVCVFVWEITWMEAISCQRMSASELYADSESATYFLLIITPRPWTLAFRLKIIAAPRCLYMCFGLCVPTLLTPPDRLTSFTLGLLSVQCPASQHHFHQNVFIARQHVNACRARYCYGISVRLSVCPSHSSIVSKRRHISSNSLRLLVRALI